MSCGSLSSCSLRWRRFRLPILCVPLNLLVNVLERVADIACIGQATLKWIHHEFLTHKKRHVFPDLNFILYLSTCVNWANVCIDLLTEVSKLFTCYARRFLIFEGATWFWLGLLFYLWFFTSFMPWFWWWCDSENRQFVDWVRLECWYGTKFKLAEK